MVHEQRRLPCIVLCGSSMCIEMHQHTTAELNSQATIYLGHFQVGSYRCRSLIEGLYTLLKPYRRWVRLIFPGILLCFLHITGVFVCVFRR